MLQNRNRNVYRVEMNGDSLTSAFKRLASRLRIGGGDGIARSIPEDALQEAFCRLWQNKDKYKEDTGADCLLAAAARNIRIDYYRHETAFATTGLDEAREAADTDDDREAEILETYNRVNRLAAESLSPRDREILFHRERDGWEFDEIASHYGISEANVRVIVSRSRKLLRELYRNQQR